MKRKQENRTLLTMKLLATALLFSLLCLPGEGAPLWNLDLDSMTKDATISTASYVTGTVNTSPQLVGTGSVLIRENFTVGSSTLSGNSVVLYKPARGAGSASTVRFTMLGKADYTAVTDYQLSFDVLVGTAVSDATSLNVRMINDHSTTSVGAIVLSTDGGKLLINSAFGESVVVENIWEPGETLHFTLQVDSTSKTFNVGVNGFLVGKITLDTSGATYPNLGIERIWFGANSDNALFADGIGIANISTSTTLTPLPIPEPASLALLGAAALILLIMRRRSR